ncbi:MAG: NFACT RNA binding domain-containing protein [Sphaerochaeta sp.]
MSVNYREIELILSELPLRDSRLQGVSQSSFSGVSFHFFHPIKRQWTLYVEVGTPHARLHRLTTGRAKLPKMQRFVQFLKANVVGFQIKAVTQTPGERFVDLTLTRGDESLHLLFRLFSGAGANIIVTDDSYTILDLLMRRPQRGEASGLPFTLPEAKVHTKKFAIRSYHGPSFNAALEKEYAEAANNETLAAVSSRARAAYEKQARALERTLAGLKTRVEQTQEYERDKHLGDLLSAYQHLIVEGTAEITPTDWLTNSPVSIALERTKKSQENIQHYYERYQRSKGSYENALAELNRVKDEFSALQATFEHALDPNLDPNEAIPLLRRLVEKPLVPQSQKPRVGLIFHSGEFTLLVGRNAKENDELLRHYTRGNDWWVHTRDFPGGYVFIKYIRDKTPPLDVLLDAANLAILYSKAKKAGKAELYYTQVKHLRRAKGEKLGTVLPTQERNLSVTLDEGRLEALLSQGGEGS